MLTTATSPDRDAAVVRSTMRVVWLIALAKLVAHVWFNNRYGFFRDEFDYMSSGEHLAWGYVDQPPLAPFITFLERALLGDSLRALRFIPALSSSLLVVQTAWLAREFGGRGFAMLLAALCVAFAPQYLSNAGLLGTNCLEPTLWLACAHCAVLAIKRAEPRWWLAFGVVAGIGLENKYTIAIFGAGVVLGLLATTQRRAFASRWIWLGGLAALLIFLPNLLWNWLNDWPFVELMRAISAEGRDVVLPAGEYFLQQFLLTGPLAGLVWIGGLIALLFSSALRPYRFLGIAYLVCYATLFTLHGKSYYLAPVYPMLLAAGAAMLDRVEPVRLRVAWRAAQAAVVVVLVAIGLHLAPLVVPVLEPDAFIAYTKTLPFKLPVMEHSHARATLPQWYADQFGWKEIVDETAVAWQRIPAEQRADCGIFAQNYGQAGAIDFFGRGAGLPPALSGDRTYFLWGPRGYSGDCMIVLDDEKEVLERYWENVEFVGTSAPNRWALETEVPVFICRTKKFASLAEIWPGLRHWR